MERTSTGEMQQASVDRSLEATMERFYDAFRRFDAKEFASFWAEDGTLLNPIGHYAKGRDEVERVFREDAARVFEGTTRTFAIVGARKVRDDCVLVDVDSEVQNFRRPDGTRGPVKMHAVVLAQRTGESWEWLDVRAYGFIPAPQLH
jgi:uncharacterized protein (TIGR02246 family)